MRVLISFLILLFVSISSNAQDSTFQMEEVFQLPDVPEGYVIMDLGIYDLNNDGIDEIVCEVVELPGLDHHYIGVCHNREWIYFSDRTYDRIFDHFVCDINCDGHLDIICETDAGVHNIYMYLGPDFEERIHDRHYFFDQWIEAAGDRVLENGETVPFFLLHEPNNDYIDIRVGFNGFRMAYRGCSIWQSSWLTDYPRKVLMIGKPLAFTVRQSDNNGTEYFCMGYTRYDALISKEHDILVNEESCLYQLFTSHNRSFNQPDSLFLFERQLNNGIDPLGWVEFCRHNIVEDLNGDGRLEWAVPHWDRIEQGSNFNIYLDVFFPDSLVFDRRYHEILRNPYFVENLGPTLIKGVASVDVNNDGVKEILFAIQKRPILILDSQSLEIIMESEMEVHDDYFWVFEVGHFDDTGRLQLIMQDAWTMRVYNLPEGWEN